MGTKTLHRVRWTPNRVRLLPSIRNAEPVFQRGEFTLSRQEWGAYTILYLRGLVREPDFLPVYRAAVEARRPIVLDLDGLQGVTNPVARKILDLVRERETKRPDAPIWVAFPPDSMADYLAVSQIGSLALIHAYADVPDDPSAVRRALSRVEREIHKLGKEIGTLRHFQVLDRDRTWICPFCGLPQAEIKVPTSLNVPLRCVYRAYRHLAVSCTGWKRGEGTALSLDELYKVRDMADRHRAESQKLHVMRLELQVKSLEKDASQGRHIMRSVDQAADRQRRLLPPAPPVIEGCDFGLLYKPAERVSGDFYDFIPLPDGRIGMVVGDVTGHGIEAGIVMGVARKVIQMWLRSSGNPALAFKGANADLRAELGHGDFITALLGVYDPSRYALTLARAGHTLPVYHRPGHKPDVIEVGCEGPAIGIVKPEVFNDRISSVQIKVEPGETILFYTDGVVEATDRAGTQFGPEHLGRILRQGHGETAQETVERLHAGLEQHAGGQGIEDDVTVICMKVR